MKKLALALAALVVLSGCAKTNGAADMKQPNTFKGNTIKVITVLNPITMFAQVTCREIFKDLQDNGYFSYNRYESEKQIAQPCTKSCDL